MKPSVCRPRAAATTIEIAGVVRCAEYVRRFAKEVVGNKTQEADSGVCRVMKIIGTSTKSGRRREQCRRGGG